MASGDGGNAAESRGGEAPRALSGDVTMDSGGAKEHSGASKKRGLSMEGDGKDRDPKAQPSASSSTQTYRLEFCAEHGKLLPFKESYQRNNKRGGHKNMRCFPHCGDNHTNNSFCGRPLRVHLMPVRQGDPFGVPEGSDDEDDAAQAAAAKLSGKEGGGNGESALEEGNGDRREILRF